MTGHRERRLVTRGSGLGGQASKLSPFPQSEAYAQPLMSRARTYSGRRAHHPRDRNRAADAVERLARHHRLAGRTSSRSRDRPRVDGWNPALTTDPGITRIAARAPDDDDRRSRLTGGGRFGGDVAEGRDLQRLSRGDLRRTDGSRLAVLRARLPRPRSRLTARWRTREVDAGTPCVRCAG